MSHVLQVRRTITHNLHLISPFSIHIYSVVSPSGVQCTVSLETWRNTSSKSSWNSQRTRSTMFLILERYKFISQLFGSRNFAQGDIVRQIYAFFFVLMTISHILAPLEYSDNRGQFIESLNGSTAYMIVLSFILHYLTNRDRFNALEMEVQDIVNDSECWYYRWEKIWLKNIWISFLKEFDWRETMQCMPK